jgi:hypothetical protein
MNVDFGASRMCQAGSLGYHFGVSEIHAEEALFAFGGVEFEPEPGLAAKGGGRSLGAGDDILKFGFAFFFWL